MRKERSTGLNTRTLVKLALVLIGALIVVELIEGLLGYDGIATIQDAIVESLLTGTVPGFLLAGILGALVGVLGVLAVLWVLGRL